MACDNYLLESLINNNIQYPILRLYGWDKLTTSVGINQSEKDIKTDGDSPIVKRITGGQAVTHTPQELTYSVVLKFGSKVKSLYNEIGEVLISFLNEYNLKGTIGYTNNHYSSEFDCFMSKTQADIVVDNIKVIGSAQCRKKNHILQHGSIKLDSISKLTSKEISFEHAAETLKKVFQNTLTITLIDYTLTKDDYKNINNQLNLVELTQRTNLVNQLNKNGNPNKKH